MKYLPNKFPYIELKREQTDGSRKYVTPDGYKVPSVTTILSATAPKEKLIALQNWRKSVGEKLATEITTEAANRGTRMHKWLENYIKNGNTGDPGSNPFSQQSHAMAQSIINLGLSNCDEFWGTEISLYFPQIYAGTTDLVGIHKGVECIMDHKQTNKPKKREWIDDYFLQLAAYATAHNEVYNTRIRKGVIFMCSKDNQYQEFIVEGVDFDNYVSLWYKKLEEYYTQFI